MIRNSNTAAYSAPNPGACSSVHFRSSVSSVQSRSSCSIHSETSSSRESDNIFGSDNYGNFGAFPKVSPTPCKINNKEHCRKKIVRYHEREHQHDRRRLETLPVLQKTAMSAFLASPSPNRWSDLVRTMRVENRINGLGFTSLHDNIDKMVDDCKLRNEHEEKNSEEADEVEAVGTYEVIGFEKTLSNSTGATHCNTSSSSRSNSPISSACDDYSNPSDESFTFTANFPDDASNEIEEYDIEPKDTSEEQGAVSFQVKLAMAEFIRDPSSHNAWSELVELFREEKAKEDGAWDDVAKFHEEEMGKAEKMNDQDFYDTVDSGQDWANFDDISNKYHKAIVQYDISFNQQCAMEAFLHQPSQENWTELVQSIRKEKAGHSEETCASLLRLQSKLEQLEEEASAAEKSWDGQLGTSSVIIENHHAQSKVNKVEFYEEEEMQDVV